MSERVGIFGGSFDPPHVGHLILADEACNYFGLDRLLWLLTPDPPHKTDLKLTDWHHRLAMLEKCLENNPQFEICRIDIDRPAPQYALDTMRLLSKKYPSADLIYIMGGDSLKDLPGWYKPDEFIKACNLIGVMHRPGEPIDLKELEYQLPGIKNKVRFMEAPLLTIASQEIRQRIHDSRAFRYYLDGKVYKYILKNHLYKE